MAKSSVDVIIPAFNAQRTIRESVASVLAQTAPDLRVIVVDDGSEDATGEIVAEMAAGDTRVVLAAQANGGTVSALNRGVGLSEAEYVARLDADDLSAPDRHARQLAFLRDHSEIIAVSGAHEEIRADGSATGRIHRPGDPNLIDTAWAPAKEPQIIQPFLMLRREALTGIGGYRRVFLAEDTDLFLRLAERGRLANLPAVLGRYRMHPGSISSASVVNGRIMAVSSQLAALSARRREAGEPDLDFPPDRLAAYQGARELAEILRIASAGLTAAETGWLAVAAAAKLMELAGYRPYEIEASDCRFIGQALRRSAALPAGNRRELEKMQAATAARLLRLGRVADARCVAPRRLWPQALVRAGTGRLYWSKHLA